MTSTPWERSKNMFVLTIGINKYQHISPLAGAVADADEMELFFRNDVGVPSNRFMKLRDESATRDNIIRALKDLQENESLGIGKDDPIVIYFAGHGILADPRECWEDEIQAICPHDVEVDDELERNIFPIPDHSLGSLLNQVSKKKGNNITVIFDCCHAASGTRDVDPQGVRCVAFHGKLPLDIDADLMEGTRSQQIPSGFLNQHYRSHVLLAACGANEEALESGGHGRFTRALLKTLRKPGVDILSYIELMKKMPSLPSQTPQCEGHFKDRVLFSTQVPEMGSHFFRVVKRANHYEIEAGDIHGITKDSLFDVFEEPVPKSTLLGTLRVEKVSALSADAVLESNGAGEIGSRTFALQVRRGLGTALKVHFSSALMDVVRRCDVLNDVPPNEVVSVERENADFIIDLNGTRAVFIVTFDTVMKHGYKGELPYTVEAEAQAISRVLFAACRWKHHLNRSPSRSYWRDEVDVELFRLPQQAEADGVPLERNDAPALNDSNEVVIGVNPDDLYGLEITNSTTQKLYLSLLVFQIGTLSIEIIYDGPIGISSGPADPPLLPDSSLQIGCGIGGGSPFNYCLPEGIDLDVAILKLYLTTKPVSLKWLEQSSPFTSTARHRNTSEDLRKPMKSFDRWDTILFTVVQCPPKHHPERSCIFDRTDTCMFKNFDV